MSYFLRALILGILIALCPFSGAVAEEQAEPKVDPAIERVAQEISETTMSPFCPGRTISACPSYQARKLRFQIQEWLEAGYSPEAVRAQLLTIYGEDVRALPKNDAVGQLAWWVPAGFVALTLVFILGLIWRLKASSAETTQDEAELPENVQLQIDEELKRRRV